MGKEIENAADLSELVELKPGVEPRVHAIPKGVDPRRVSDLTSFQIGNALRAFTQIDTGRLLSSLPDPSADRVSISFKKRMRKDPAIALGMALLKSPIRNVEWWVYGDDKDSAALAEEVLKLHYKRLCRLSLRALDFGWQPFEWVWEPQTIQVKNDRLKVDKTFRDVLVPRAFHEIDPGLCEPIVDRATHEFLGIKRSGVEKMVPRHKLFVVSNDPEYGDPRGQSLLDKAYRSYYWCELALILAARYFESRAIPNLKGFGPAGKNVNPATNTEEDNVTIILAALDALRHGKQVALPSDVDEETKVRKWDIEELSSDKRGDMFVEYTEFLDKRKLMGLLTPPQVGMQGSNTGSNAETKEKVATWQDILEMILDDVWVEPINSQFLPMLTKLNFGVDAKPPVFRTSGFKRTDIALFSRVIDKVFTTPRKIKGSGDSDKGVGTPSMLVDIERLFAENRIPLVDLDEFEAPPMPTPGEKPSGPSGEKRRDILTDN